MSDLNVALSATGFIGLERDKAPTESLTKVAEADKSVDNNPLENITGLGESTETKAVQFGKPLASAEVEVVVEDMNAFMQSMQRNLSFTIDEQLGQEIISVTDVETNEVIRQIPSEELVVLRKKLDDVVGILFDTKV